MWGDSGCPCSVCTVTFCVLIRVGCWHYHHRLVRLVRNFMRVKRPSSPRFASGHLHGPTPIQPVSNPTDLFSPYRPHHTGPVTPTPLPTSPFPHCHHFKSSFHPTRHRQWFCHGAHAGKHTKRNMKWWASPQYSCDFVTFGCDLARSSRVPWTGNCSL